MSREINKTVIVGVLFLMLILPMVSAGVGVKWDRESSLVGENSKTCLTYNLYNPFPGDVYAKVVLSSELKDIVSSGDSEVVFIPAYTSSDESVPVTFCFKTPRVYQRDCLIGNSLICKQDCNESLKVFEGDVEAIQLSEDQAKIGGAGGSKTTMSVSAPLRVRVQCNPHGRDYSIVYSLVALIAGILLLLNVLRSRREKSSLGSKKIKSSKKK